MGSAEMRAFAQVLLVLSLGAFASAQDTYWRHMLTTFGPIPGISNWFAAQPRTLTELTDEGWVQISSCDDNNPNFPGDRFVRSVDDKDIVVLLDGNGFIAGIQSVVMKEYTMDDQFYNFTKNPYYVLGDWNGEEAYFQTVYFVDTAIICNGGRTEEEFLNEGTGNRFSWQNGPTNMDLQEIPLTKDEMLGNDEWYEHFCFVNMGEHFFPMPPAAGDDYDCNEGMPLMQVTYWRGVLNGFIFSHFADLPGNRWEKPSDPSAIGLIANEPPKCLLDFAEQGMLSTMHVWVDDYIVTCIGD